MKIIVSTFLIIYSTVLFASEEQIVEMDLPPEQAELLKSLVSAGSEQGEDMLEFELPKPAASKWVVRFTFGPIRVRYFRADVEIENRYMNLEIRKVEITERNNHEAYLIWSNSNGFNAFQFIDEATNMGVLSFENVEKEFSLNLIVMHPKFLMTDGADPRVTNQYAEISGVMYGKPVDGTQRINDYITSYRMTYGFMNYQVQFEKILPMVTFKNRSSLRYSVGLSAGVYSGGATVVIPTEEDRWSYYGSDSKPFSLIGTSASFSNKVTYVFQNDRFSLSAMHQITNGSLKFRVFDGIARQTLDSQLFNISLGVKLFEFRR